MIWNVEHTLDTDGVNYGLGMLDDLELTQRNQDVLSLSSFRFYILGKASVSVSAPGKLILLIGFAS